MSNHSEEGSALWRKKERQTTAILLTIKFTEYETICNNMYVCARHLV